MNEVQQNELRRIREEQAALAGRMAQLEERVSALQSAVEAEAVVEAEPIMVPAPPPLPPEALLSAMERAKVQTQGPLPVPVAVERRHSAVTIEEGEKAKQQAADASSEKAAMEKAGGAADSLEMRIGTTWLVRIGVVLLLTSLTFLGSYLYKNVVPQLGPWAKVGLLYLGAGALTALGARLERGREAQGSHRMLNFARVVLAGGLSAIYYVTYAAHWNSNLLVLRDPVLDGALLLGLAGLMVWLAHRRGSDVLATFAILLAFYTSSINEKAGFTLFSNVALAVAAAWLLRQHLWRVFPFASIAATYGSDLFWRAFHLASGETGSGLGGGSGIEFSFVIIYWLLFTVTTFFPGRVAWPRARRAGFISVNNVAFFALATAILQGPYPGSVWKFALGFGVLLATLGEVGRWRGRLDASAAGAYLLEGVLFVTLGLLAQLDGWQLGLVLAAQSVVLLWRAQLRGERLPLWCSLGSAGAAFCVCAQQLEIWGVRVPWLSLAGVGALLVGAASGCRWQNRRAGRDLPKTLFGIAPELYAALGAVIWLGTVERTLHGEPALLPALAGGAIALVALSNAARVLALAWAGEGFLLVACSHRLAVETAVFPHAPMPAPWGLLAMFVSAIALGHWWHGDWPRKTASPPVSAFAALNAVLSALILSDWLRSYLNGPDTAAWSAGAAGLSLALLVYGFVTRYRAVAGAGQILLLESFAGCIAQIWDHPAPAGLSAGMAWSLAPLVAALATISVTRRFLAAGENRGLIEAWAVACEVTATLYGLAWGTRYIPEEGRFAFFAVVAAALCAWSFVRRASRWTWWGGILGLFGISCFVFLTRENAAAWIHFLGIAAFVAAQRFARLLEKVTSITPSVIPNAWHAALMTAATLCAWDVLSARILLLADGTFTLATAWSMFAAVVFCAGLFWRERIYRWLALGLLVCSFVRIGAYDIWQLDSLGRAVSALCLGVVLLGVGYFYNRFHSKWHALFS